MLSKTFTYPDMNGVERTRTFYFNISLAEVAELEMIHSGGFKEFLERIVSDSDGKKIVATFKEIIEMSYGVKTDDGFFVKDDVEFKKFHGSEAYSQLFMGIIADAGAASEFINGIMPASLNKEKAPEPAAGFRPGAQVLPQSRLDALAAEKANNERFVSEEPEPSAADIRAEIERQVRAEMAQKQAPNSMTEPQQP